MGARNAVVTVCAITLSGVLTAACSSQEPVADSTDGTISTESPTSPGGDPSGAATTDPGGSKTGASPDARGATDVPGAATPSDGTGGVEVLPEQPGASAGLPGLDQAPAPTGALITTPMPSAGSARGRLVTGYPAKVLPVAARSQIQSSSVSPGGERLQVALGAKSPRGPDSILRFYRVHLARLGFVEKPTSAVGGSQAAAFNRGQSSVVVTVSRASGTSSYSLFSTLYAG